MEKIQEDRVKKSPQHNLAGENLLFRWRVGVFGIVFRITQKKEKERKKERNGKEWNEIDAYHYKMFCVHECFNLIFLDRLHFKNLSRMF